MEVNKEEPFWVANPPIPGWNNGNGKSRSQKYREIQIQIEWEHTPYFYKAKDKAGNISIEYKDFPKW